MTGTPDHTESIFAAAVALVTAEERAAYLDQACAGDAALRGHVEALLRAHERHGHLLDRPVPGGLEQTGASMPNEQPGAVIAGRYKLLEAIGEGGMGAVWVAEQTQPVRRKVALKLIKAGMDSKSVLARFEAERQALAVMDHPNIAKVLDGGLTETGRPFFVMEYVKGMPITQYCEATRLSVPQRLQLFAQVCQAVQHAHMKGIIHRDLKPSNILVAPYDDKPVPKVIDFGLAKAMHQSLTERTLHTAHETVLGTPLYMSPEQAQLNNLDVDTRSDIYSLGVLLYELLTRTTPLEKKRFKEAAWDEVRRIIREEEPARPSTRLSSANTLPSLAAARQTDPARLTKLVRGELDWIVMKALEKDRARRYETANGLAADVQRYLAGEPVLAAPPSARYRLGKFASKHRTALTAAAAITLLLGAGVVAVVAVQVRANHDLAAKNAELADEQAKVQARFEMAQKAIATFHTGVSEDMLLKNDQFKELRTKLLKEAAGFYADLEKLLVGQTDARSRKALAAGYFQLGELTEKIGSKPEALAVHRKALAVQRELAGLDVETRLDVARSLLAVGQLLRGTGDNAGALAAFEEARDLAERLEAGDPTDAVRSVLALSHYRIGSVLSKTGKPAEAMETYRKALAIRQKLADAYPAVTDFQSDLARSHMNISSLLGATGKWAEAMEADRKALTIRQKLADANPAVTEFQLELAQSHFAIGNGLWVMGKPAEALEALRKALAIRQKLADAYPAVTDFQFSLSKAHNNIGVVLRLTGKPAEAMEAYRTALEIQQKLADANPKVTDFQSNLANSHSNIGLFHSQMGKSAEALEAYRTALDMFQKLADANLTVTDFEAYVAWSHDNIGVVLSQMGKPAEAMEAYRKALDILQKLAADNPAPRFFQMALAQSHDNIGRLLARQKRFAEAFTALDAGLTIRQKLAEKDPKTPFLTSFLGDSHASRGWARVRAAQPTEAAADLRLAVALWAKDPSPDIGKRFEKSRALALLAGLSGDAKSDVTAAEAAAFADQAVAALADAIKAGWARLDELKEPDFDSLRGREDFKKQFAEVEQKSRAKAEKKP
jgi:serine/threonine protein kinase